MHPSVGDAVVQAGRLQALKVLLHLLLTYGHEDFLTFIGLVLAPTQQNGQSFACEHVPSRRVLSPGARGLAVLSFVQVRVHLFQALRAALLHIPCVKYPDSHVPGFVLSAPPVDGFFGLVVGHQLAKPE